MTDAAPVSVAHDLSYYLRPIRRHPKLVAGCVLLGLILSIALAASIRPVYTATAKVQVNADIIDNTTSLANGRTNGAVNMDNEVQVLKSLPVAQIAQQTLKTTTPLGKLEKKITFVVPPNSTVMKISCSGHSPTSAADCANAFAKAYLTNRQNTIDAYVKGQTDKINAKLATYKAQLNTDSNAVHATPARSAARRNAVVRQNQDKKNITNEDTQLTSLNTENTLPPSTLESPAVPGGSSPNQKREMIVVAGIVLGALLGLAAAPLRERLDKLVRTEDDLAREGLELIAEIKPLPRGRRGRTAAARKADALSRTRAEQRLAAVIGAALGQEGGSVYLAELSDAVGEQGFAERLAAELGRFGSTTEVVTMGAAPRPTIDTRTLDPIAQTLAIDAAPVEPGPASAPMLGWPTTEPHDEPGTQVVHVPSSPPPAQVPAPVAQPKTAPPMDEVAGVLQDVQAALARSRYVIVHGPNATLGSEAYNLASLSVVTALIVDAGVTTREQLADVVDQIEVTASEVLGAMLWRPPPRRKRQFGRSRNASTGSPQTDVTPRAERPARDARPTKGAAATKPAKAPKAKPDKAAKAKPDKAPKAKGASPQQPAQPPRSVRLLRKKSPPVDGFVPSSPSSPTTVPFTSDDDADPGSRARPFNSAR